ncbi:uncharacterized protein Cda5 isoform X4 [Euwallacea fornicatus]|uniref:uncharacterized protein Cda5 isoform X4 n=1 Tax=Euwallacea fornicatus TaxID=995702 RepID=UPI00338DB7B5
MVSTHIASAILLSAVQITLLIGLAEGQRKARPLPTASEAKERERANFDCPEEFGYYPHPKDCTQYYVCVFGGALLESCTGGLMYSHELQTCDWPRNVGCDGLELAPGTPSAAPVAQRNRERSREREKDDPRIADSRTKYSPPPPPQPKAVVTSRGQPRQLQNQQDIIKQLYDAVEESLPPAEEIESDRQQRVYRGQPSTVGQVQRDRDGYRHSNVLPTREKIGVISFGTQSQLQHYSEEKSPVSQAPISTATATARTLYNSSQYNNINQNDNRYDPFYALYDEDAEIYKDVDYTPQNNNYQTNPPSTRGSTTTVYRGSPAPVRDETPKRGNIVYNNVNQDIYQQSSTVSDYNDNSYQEEDPAYRQSSRATSSHRGDRNEINDIEEVATTKRTSSTPAIRKSSTTAQARTLSPQKITTTPSSQAPVTAIENQTQVALSNNTNPGHVDVPDSLNTPFESTTDFEPDLHEPYTTKLTPLEHLTTVEPAFHYITKAPKSTHQVSSSTVSNANVDVEVQPSVKLKFIVPTTYSPPKYLRKSILRNSSIVSPSLFSFRQKNQTKSNPTYQYKTLKAVRKLINPITLNHELEKSNGATYELAEDIVSNLEEQPQDSNSSTTSTTTTLSSTTTSIPTTTIKNRLFELLSKERQRPYIENDKSSSEKHFSLTVEIPPPQDFLPDADEEKVEPDQPPSYKPRPPSFSRPDSKTEPPLTASLPARVSRVNAAIKSLIAIGGTKGPTKCTNKGPKCKVEAKQRTPSRGRGTSHYTNSASIASNEVTVNVNRGTPAPRSRPTLKPSTSIVSKASEFIDIYRNPPRRPDALYPQPQPDKTAAKCRKDVCLLPDCYCGGKDIPGDLPVEQVPQIVLLTFDDSVNDLNKGLYQDLFERGRTNPNGCPIAATFYVSHEWTDYSQVQNLYSDGHELASHTVSHSFGEQFSQKKWTREVAGQREILAAYGGVKLDDVKGMRAPFLSVGGNKMFKMLYDSNFTYDSSMPIYENKPPSWPYTLDYKLFHDCMIPPCPTRSYPGVWEVPMVMWQDLNGGRCSMGDACSNPPDADGVFKMLIKNFERHYTTNRAPFGLFYHAAWFTQPHHKEGFINFIDTILTMKDVWLITNWQALQWVRDPVPISRLNNFQPFQCDYSDRPKRCNNPKVCNLWHKSGVRYMRTCQPCPDIYPWTGNTGIRSSKIDNDIED